MTKEINMKYGKWTVIGDSFRKGKSHYYTPCRCECGTEKDIATSALKSGLSTQCRSCATRASKTTHGMVGTAIYGRWEAMKNRCANQKAYKNVTVEWNSFEEFNADMGGTFNEDYELDRRDNTGNYNKSNCRWVPQVVNAGNKSNHSQYGVGIYKRKNKYLAKVESGGEVIFYEKYHDLDEALKCRDAFIIENNLNNKLNLEVA